jgi:hypothetical protein
MKKYPTTTVPDRYIDQSLRLREEAEQLTQDELKKMYVFAMSNWSIALDELARVIGTRQLR